MIQKEFNLESRTFDYAKTILKLCKESPRVGTNFPIIDQVVRSSGSVGANYIEANEALSKKDFFHRIRICRKEAKESNYWLRLLAENNSEKPKELQYLLDESTQLVKIFSAIINKNKSFGN